MYNRIIQVSEISSADLNFSQAELNSVLKCADWYTELGQTQGNSATQKCLYLEKYLFTTNKTVIFVSGYQTHQKKNTMFKLKVI